MKLSKKCSCCSFVFPDISTQWLLFFEFIFMFGTTVIYFADIVTDIITLYTYFQNRWYYAFGLSIFFIVVPSILLAILEYNFLRKTDNKSGSYTKIIVKTILNVPFQLTVIWYHCELSYTCLKNWLNHIRGVEQEHTTSAAQWYKPTTLERSRGASLSSLNELDYDKDFTADRGLMQKGNLSGSVGSLGITNQNEKKKKNLNWWKVLTKEQWLSHLNKLKLSESMLESLPQLLINLFVIIWYPNTAAVQYISAVLSYLSLCGGVVRYDKTKKDNEADSWMADRTLLHSRVSYSRLEWAQLLFISIYKACFLAARSLAFVYFTIFFFWYVLIPIFLHWSLLLAYLVYRWYPDFTKVTRQLRQADNKYRAYVFLSKDFVSVLLESLVGIFIYVRPYYLTFMDQPYCFMFLYYVAYVSENLVLFLLPGIIQSPSSSEDSLELFKYYPLLFTEVVLNVVGSLVCAIYYLAVHKSRAYTAHAYPMASRALCCLCYSSQTADDFSYWLPIKDEWTVCKQVETSELFFISKDQLKSFRQTYNTVARNDRRKSRSIECFIDDRCRIFYAPRSQLIKLPSGLRDDNAASQFRKAELQPLKGDERDDRAPSIANDIHVMVEDGATAYIHPSPPEPLEAASNRPVRKPRVKSLRDRLESPDPDRPVPLPRKNIPDVARPPQVEFSPSLDDGALSSRDNDQVPSGPTAIDDSTYRVKKPKVARKYFRKMSDPDAVEESLGHDRDNMTSVVKEWPQTWL